MPHPPVVVAGFYPPPYGGESIHVSKLAEGLEKRGLLGVRLDLNRGASPRAGTVPAGGPRRCAQALARHVRRDTLLHLHTHGHSGRSWTVAALGALALRRSGAPGVLTLHSGLSPAWLHERPAWSRPGLRWVASSYRRIICVNHQIATALTRLTADEGKVRVIPAFLPGRASPPEDTEVAALGGASPLLSMVSGVGPEYGVELMLEALPSVAREKPGVMCLVLGHDGSGGLSERTRRSGVSTHVRFLGSMPHERCLGWIGQSDLFVRPSLADGDALSVREALALGVPVLASDTGCRPDGARLFRLGDAGELAAGICRVLAGHAERRPRTQPDFFDPILQVYRETCGEAPSR